MHEDAVFTRPASHPWMPASPCGAHCLPCPHEHPGIGAARSTVRLTATAAMIALRILISLLYPALGHRTRRAVDRAWSRLALRAMGIRLVVRGEQPARWQRLLVVCNHRSWLDVIALNAVRPTTMLANVDVRGWPLLGWIAAAAGTVFIDRTRLSALPGTVARLAGILRDGSAVTVFPEGTTRCGVDTGHFRHAPFQAALDAGAAVRPVALRFLTGGHPTSAPALVGEVEFWDSMRRVCAMRDLVIELEVMPDLPARSSASRQELAALAESVVVAALHRNESPVQALSRVAPRT
ncbi:1-acyl-sn-glycerol-3-phosphate acyltransferase [Saccharothrix ecbatanensis]|uniref:1-acyl-sn-glycerol-3-phosphate acyltransferase n=1 Tax=Saccharothrix ecbatanensis TaxID=1105145 RepID=A0A7W9M0R3_9PSEU|nr:lysophospholipid acyltransferase family protein [Saccharothrix ecbatanensis]MBB5803068.1 1-acyl-sn-glycerol-3-phosphate acyltransferase [Saccharothrix ecbatanensis]